MLKVRQNQAESECHCFKDSMNWCWGFAFRCTSNRKSFGFSINLSYGTTAVSGIRSRTYWIGIWREIQLILESILARIQLLVSCQQKLTSSKHQGLSHPWSMSPYPSTCALEPLMLRHRKKVFEKNNNPFSSTLTSFFGGNTVPLCLTMLSLWESYLLLEF